MNINDWLHETQENNSRFEKIYKELVLNRHTDNHSFWKSVLFWLESSYDAGHKDANNSDNHCIIK